MNDELLAPPIDMNRMVCTCYVQDEGTQCSFQFYANSRYLGKDNDTITEIGLEMKQAIHEILAKHNIISTGDLVLQ